MSRTLMILLGILHVCYGDNKSIRIMSFNVWLSGKSVLNGVEKIIRHIREVDADVVAMQEITEESVLNEAIKVLGENWDWVRCSKTDAYFPDVAILTRLEIMSQCVATSRAVGVVVEAHEAHPVLIWSAHFNYKMFGSLAAQIKLVDSMEHLIMSEHQAGKTLAEYADNMNGARVVTMIGSRTSGRVKNAHDLLVHPLVIEWQNRGLAVIVAGDLNSPSHLDWIEETRDTHGGWVVKWPVTELFESSGFIDAYRHLHPDILTYPGHTWSPIQSFSKEWDYKYVPEPQDRLDYVFYSGALTAVNASLYCGTKPLLNVSMDGRHKRNDFPSDHYALIVDFLL